MNCISKQALRATLLAAAALGLAGVSAVADVVELKDGSRLVGQVVRMQDGKIKLITEFAGEIIIDATQLVRIETEQPVEVALSTGDKLVGTIEYSDSAEVPVIKTQVGDIPVSVDKMDAIWEQGGKSPEILALEEQSAKLAEENAARLPKWTLTLEIGATYTEGNTDTLNARGRIEARRSTEVDQLVLYILGNYGEENDSRSEAEAKAGMQYEYLFTERIFAFINSELEYDEFENLKLRAIVAGGVGVYWLKDPGHELKTGIGAGMQHETFFDDTNDTSAILELGLDYLLEINPWLTFTHAARYYPTFDGIDDYRLTFDSALVFPIGESDIWKIKLGALYEYDSMPNAGRESLDQTYYGNLVAELK